MNDFEYELVGCSDHNCIITTPKREGMGTNGGCQCAKELQRIGPVGLNVTRKIRLLEMQAHNLTNRITQLECRMVNLPPKRTTEEFVYDIDGFIYYWPHGSKGGHYAAHQLRRIATELDDRNKEWDDQINNMIQR